MDSQILIVTKTYSSIS